MDNKDVMLLSINKGFIIFKNEIATEINYGSCIAFRDEGCR